MNKKGESLMNWDDSQLASSAFAKGHGGLSLGQRWGLASILRGNSDYSSREDLKSAKKKKEIDDRLEVFARAGEKYRKEIETRLGVDITKL